jgi:hypothetical protein
MPTWNKPKKTISERITDYKRELTHCARKYEQATLQVQKQQQIKEPWTQEELDILKQMIHKD